MIEPTFGRPRRRNKKGPRPRSEVNESPTEETPSQPSPIGKASDVAVDVTPSLATEAGLANGSGSKPVEKSELKAEDSATSERRGDAKPPEATVQEGIAAIEGEAAASRITTAPPIKPEHVAKFDEGLPRRAFVSDMPDRGLYIAFVVGGFSLIMWLKLSGYDPRWVAGLAAASMLLYGLLAYRLPAVRLRADRLGDNFYYLGFVFTLASVSAALLELQGSSDLTNLIGSFGIALLTTILGIAGRVVLVQMRDEVDDIEERVRHDLLEAANQLRGRLSAAVVDLDAFRIGLQATVHQRLEESLERYTDVTRKQIASLTDVARGAMEKVDEAFGANHKHAQDLNRIAQMMVEAGEGLLKRIESIDPPSDLLERKLDTLLAKLEATGNAFVDSASADKERQAALSDLTKQLRETTAELAALKTEGASLINVARPIQDLAATIGVLQGKIAAVVEVVTMEATQLTKAVSTAEADAARVGEMNRRILEDLEASRKAVARVQSAMAETALVVADYLQTNRG